MKRQKTKKVTIGKVIIGGNNPVAVQSMTKTFTEDVKATVAQIKKLQIAGCQIIRCAVPNREAARALAKIKKQISIPLVADIHFDYRLALMSIDSGADKIRINPGNIGSQDKLKEIVAAAKHAGIPIRVGVNSGSLEKSMYKKYKHVNAKALAESALKNVLLLEKLGFDNIVISAKATSVPMTIETYRIISEKVDYPLHVGVTESGIPEVGVIPSSIGIGTLLAEGIGDTIRVSLTGDPVLEVKAGYDILKSLDLYKGGVTILSCPTCGRTKIDVVKIARQVEQKTKHIKKPIKIAIMGCVVNGPGEAAEADVGMAGGDGVGLIFSKGKVVKKVRESQMVSELIKEIKRTT